MKIILSGSHEASMYIESDDNTLFVSYDRGKTFASVRGEKGEKGDRGQRGSSAKNNATEGEILVADGNGGAKSSGFKIINETINNSRNPGFIPTWNCILAYLKRNKIKELK